MRSRWRRWRGYMDEMEELMRVVGEQLREGEALVAEDFEREAWPLWQREAVPRELVRRALTIPVLGRLLQTALDLPPGEALTETDMEAHPWGEDESTRARLSASYAPENLEIPARGPHAPPPARLRAAERTLRARTRSLVVVCERLTSVRNASAIVRTADALGLQEVHFIQPEGKFKLNRSVTRACQRWLDLYWHRDSASALAHLRERGYRVLAADFGEGAVPVESVALSDKVALVLGSEQEGVSPELAAQADGLFYISTVGFTSYLNVSVAAAIALHTTDARMRDAGHRAPLTDHEQRALRRAWYPALAGGRPERVAEYAAWIDAPPDPAPVVKRVPSREKRAREDA